MDLFLSLCCSRFRFPSGRRLRISYQGFFPASMRRLFTMPIPMLGNVPNRTTVFVHANGRALHMTAIPHPTVSTHHIPASMYRAIRCRFTRAGSSAAARQRCSSAEGSLGACCVGFMVVWFCLYWGQGPNVRSPISPSYSSNLGFRISE